MRACVRAQADCCDTTESVTNQLEKHRWDVPNVFLRQGWREAQSAVPSAEELAGGRDECAAGCHSATGAWLELREIPAIRKGKCRSGGLQLRRRRVKGHKPEGAAVLLLDWRCPLHRKELSHDHL